MRLVLRRAAKLDLVEAYRWYEEQRPGLGESFRAEVKAVLATLQAHPQLFPRVGPRIRRATTGQFPYGIFYLIDGETIRVLAILHRARDPEIWRSRR
ncbi:MAG TPA: type II toxin-antitoxin system RelE/ParE family toxin [Thermoanaerobaculia bacterium]|nr:type II toxin-antitoxin system RelE/ParE family toxin [Thermoanaerobaculia bacterium]